MQHSNNKVQTNRQKKLIKLKQKSERSVKVVGSSETRLTVQGFCLFCHELSNFRDVMFRSRRKRYRSVSCDYKKTLLFFFFCLGMPF